MQRKVKKLKRAGAADESEEDFYEDGVQDLANIFDDTSAGQRSKNKSTRRADADINLVTKANRALDVNDLEEDDMADFIEEDSPDEGDPDAREGRTKRKRQEKAAKRRKNTGFSMGGLDISTECARLSASSEWTLTECLYRAWDEIQEIFGDGHDYDDALESDDEEGKPQPTLRDVFEPSEIVERMMTDADDIIRAIDIPERMQIAQAGIVPRVVSAANEVSDLLLEQDQLNEASNWVSTRISNALTAQYLTPKDGLQPPLQEPFLHAIRRVLHFLCYEYFEVPFIWVHRRDYFIHHNPDAPNPQDRSRPLLSREDLWKIYGLAIKYRAMLDRKANLLKLWQTAQAQDIYFSDLFTHIDSLEEAADLVEYVMLKYQKKFKALALQAGTQLITEENEADVTRNGPGGEKYKRATSNSKYEKAKESLAARFAMVSDLCIGPKTT